MPTSTIPHDLPTDLPTDPIAAYQRGYSDGQRTAGGKAAAKLGSIRTDAKAITSRANGAKGGRPRKSPVEE